MSAVNRTTCDIPTECPFGRLGIMADKGKKRIRKSPQERKREIIAAAGRLIHCTSISKTDRI